MNYRIINHTLGRVLKLEAIFMLPSLICSLCYKEFRVALIFLISSLLCLLAGTLLSLKKPLNKNMFAREGFVIVALSWIFISIFGAVPFMLTGAIPNFTDALFETVSGFTTTGSTILSDVEVLPKGLLFWRSFTHWIGGMGVLVFLVALFPSQGGSNIYLVQAESPGPSVSKLVPKVKSTAKILYSIYIGLTLLQIALLLLGNIWLSEKISLFDALTTTFGTAGTGGFGVRNSSIADYTPYVQTVVTIFMIIFGVDFSIYYLILLKKARSAFRSVEVRTYLAIIIIASVIVGFNSLKFFDGSILDSLRHSLFQVSSIITTTGFTTENFELWPALSKSILVGLMFVGACAGSTGGGMKVSRIIILFKSILKEIKLMAHPGTVIKLKMNGRSIEHETVRAVNVYTAAYFLLFAISVLIISIDGFDFTTNFTAVAATINNVGPGLSEVGPICNFSGFSPLSTIVLIFDMLLGRLEIFPLLLLLSPYTWKK